MIVAFDIGNSFVKWKISGEFEDISVERGSCKLAELDRSLQHLSSHKFKRVVYSNVTNSEQVNRIQGLIKADQWQAVKSCKNLLGVTNAYSEPELLGVDRWVAAVEAYNRFQSRPVMVVDAGTAITIDVVDADGLHQGGFIVPNGDLMQRSLAMGTNRVRINEKSCEDYYGRSTNCAVKAGLMRMTRAWLREEVDLFNRCFPEGVILFTGGARLDFLLQQDNFNIYFEEDLLLDGLLRVAKA